MSDDAATRTVYVTSEDPKLDYTPAYAHGKKLVGIFPPGQVHLSPQIALYRAREQLRNMQPGDFIALAGDPVKIAICAVVAAELFGTVKFLRFNRNSNTYTPIEVDFTDRRVATSD